MASDEDARAAARRIVEQVLADRTGTDARGSSDRRPAAAAVTSAPVAEAPEAVADDPRLERLVDETVEDLVADPVADVPEDVSEARARARALVAEVLADHEARSAAGAADLEPAAEVEAAAEVEPVADVEPVDPPAADRQVTAETTARLRARELVAAVLAEAEARDAAAAAAEEAEVEAVRRAEAEAEAARAREEEAARELAAALAEESERELWADADRDAASRTQPLQRSDEVTAAQPGGDADPGPDETRPLSVAELAAAERAARGTDPEAGSDGSDGSAERTAVLSVAAGATAASRDEAGATGTTRLDDDGSPTSAEEATDETGVLEATVDPSEVDPPRTGRWLLASILGAVTLAILFPLAIRALLDLVSLS